MVSNFSNSALPLLLLPFIARELGPAEYGKVGYFFAGSSLLSTIFGFSTVAFIRHKLESNTYQEVVAAVLQIIVAVSIVCSLLLVTLFSSTDKFDKSILSDIGLCFAVGLAQAVTVIRLALWQMNVEVPRYSVFLISQTLVNLTLSVIFIFFVNMGANGRIWGYAVACMLGAFIAIYTFKVPFRQLFVIRKSFLCQIVKYSYPLVPHSVVLVLLVFVERHFVLKQIGEEALGLYFAAFQLALPIAIFITSINLQFKVTSNRLMKDGLHSRSVSTSYFVMLIFSIFGFGYAFVLAHTYTYILGEGFSGALEISYWLIVAGVLKGFYLVVSKGLFFSGHTKIIMNITLIIAALYIPFLTFLTNAIGFSVANALLNFFMFVAVWALTYRYYPQPWFSFLKKSQRS